MHGPTGLTRRRLFLLAMIAGLGSLAMHMVIPALPSIAHELRTDQPTAQLVVAVYLAGLGIGQLLAGPMSDSLGRKRVLLAGLALFCVASILAGLSPSIELLVAVRFAQALGGAVGVVSSRAIISDMSHGHEATGRIAALTTVVLLSPMIAPSLGGAIAGWGNWRYVFGVLALAGMAAWVLAALRLPSASAPSIPFSPRAVARVYRRLAGSDRFRRYALANAAASSGLYIFLGGSPFLLIGLWGLEPEEAGLCYLGVTSAGVMGTLFVKRLERNGGAFRTGLSLMVAGGSLMLLLAALGFAGPGYLLVPMFVICGGSGIAAPAGIAGAMHAEPGVAGTASSIAGAFQMLASAIASSVVGAVGAGSFRTLAAAILIASVLGLLVAPRGRSVLDKEALQ
jgi:DHA1 family bicyclomycin/chloramphenicol resistance-like MFS transporter